MSILIVEDSRANQLILASLLTDAGHTAFQVAGSAQEAFTRLKLDQPGEAASAIDLILMDIVLPYVDGIQACRRIKAAEPYRDVPIIMVTSLTGTAKLEEAFAAGAMDYITKPYNKTELLVRIRSALALKREIDCRKHREQELLQVMHQLAEANLHLERLSFVDGLTGIANRRYFDAALQEEWRRAAREQTSLALALIDVDCFKAYNDTYGHQQGDVCLKEVAGALKGSLHRAGDLVARYGGEEYVALLPHTERRGVAAVAETMRRRVENLGLLHEKGARGRRVTISVGVAATLPVAGASAQPLLQAADQALYEAKRAGRNCVHAGPVPAFVEAASR